ncbi:hypothetical protein [Henriciella pelagia]|jgi:hypothetical protein|uniref:Uncharacterized protein n=1 Tax=Henriciella pelagia TaxID=1977912 RepID=A0ABQ1JFB1_9PROT|nr:hypothetical protein [Henriciella pelagia]GGB67478.1 hypothetical protein GCM10011503_15350 [Henriciella pelagia]
MAGNYGAGSTRTTPEPAYFTRKTEPVGRKREVIVCHKPCEPWRNTDQNTRKLPWAGLHPKAKDFLATEATLQKLSSDYAPYAQTLIEGGDLSEWHDAPLWKEKQQKSRSKSGPVTVYNPLERAAFRMAHQAFQTASGANGQIVERTVKEKNVGFRNPEELRLYLEALLRAQDQICALSGLDLNLDEQGGDKQLLASLDRIDSNGQYEEGNLQIVCRFINRWKSADDNAEFQRLLGVLNS